LRAGGHLIVDWRLQIVDWAARRRMKHEGEGEESLWQRHFLKR
jgi:hypothetical protein